jgi:hypothetical protein
MTDEPDPEKRQRGNVMTFARPKEEPPRSFEPTKMETKLLSLGEMFSWILPPFQREEVQTKKVIEFADELRTNQGMVGGVILLGVLRGAEESAVYLVDGQQRRKACEISGQAEFIADVCTKHYNSMADMAEDFKRVNGRLVPFKPDDLLRACELSHPTLKQLRDRCPFIGYGNIRRYEDRSPTLSVSIALKCWFGSGQPTPVAQGQAVALLDQLDEIQSQNLSVFLLMAHKAWGNDRQYGRLWANLNLTMCMYLYRKLVLDPSNRRVPLPKEMFGKALMSVSANGPYYDWLQGRSITERDRSPCYKRLKSIFVERLTQEYNGKLFKLPHPDWASN